MAHTLLSERGEGPSVVSRLLGRRPRPFLPPSATPKCCNTDDRHPQAHDLGYVQAVSAPSKGKDQAIPTRPIHRKQQAAEKYE